MIIREIWIIFFISILQTAIGKLTEELIRQNKIQQDSKHRIRMGVSNVQCDDAKTNLELDYNDSPVNYSCYQKYSLPIDEKIESIYRCHNLTKDYTPQHFCMKDSIQYDEMLPTHGDHRPLWPVYGEYLFVPPQRWLHNIEHGAIVMLYHPCADRMMVAKLKRLLTTCIRKHIITPDAIRVSIERPLVLIAWACRLEMNNFNASLALSFIKKHSLQGPEGTYPKEGQFTRHLIRKATIPFGSNYKDEIICPFLSF
ncbi:DUF3105 domain containing protein [Sarcoptes scabiei]|uniref:DUF3105 domain containing protein n=1 Tax=Sarcoptes scabiei TaxID=52283 RepID=A0A132A611_SARSC|nr:DUF3105 domain containing protein [Sarcoptes scabiei]